MSLTERTDEEISELLTEYGIKHGPIVDSTRGLYEKKLEKAMESAAVKPSSDKTYYREEEEEVTYITYHSPVRHEAFGDGLKRRGNTNAEEEEEEEEEEDEESDEETAEPPVQVSHRAVNHSAVRTKQPVRGSGGCMWKIINMLLLLAALAGAYYVYTQVVNKEESSSGIQ